MTSALSHRTSHRENNYNPHASISGGRPHAHMTRKHFVQHSTVLVSLISSLPFLFCEPASAWTTTAPNASSRTRAFLDKNGKFESVTELDQSATCPTTEIAYKTIFLNVPNFDVTVPVACWYPKNIEDSTQNRQPAVTSVKYEHRISVKRIGQLLAGWDFIPEFATKNFALAPATPSCTVVHGTGNSLSSLKAEKSATKIVILAHGYLGSRFDLSHYAEELSQQGFVCLSPEYPESLAASYPRVEGLDRSKINSALLQVVEESVQGPKSFGIVGHSAGCGTALLTGDDTWARVLIAGRPPPDPTSPILFVSSINDGTVRFGNYNLAIPKEYNVLQEADIPAKLPRQSALVFNGYDAPNHISYLSEGVNNAMIDLLSPLLPVAKTLSIPVLDFDKYLESQDSVQTAKIMKPLISNYLLQQM